MPPSPFYVLYLCFFLLACKNNQCSYRNNELYVNAILTTLNSIFIYTLHQCYTSVTIWTPKAVVKSLLKYKIALHTKVVHYDRLSYKRSPIGMSCQGSAQSPAVPSPPSPRSRFRISGRLLGRADVKSLPHMRRGVTSIWEAEQAINEV